MSSPGEPHPARARTPRPDLPGRGLRAALGYLSVVRLLLVSTERFVYPFLPAIARGLGITLPQAGLLLAGRSLGAVSAPLTATLAGRGGRHRRLALVALALFVAGAALVALPGALAVTVIGFVLLGSARPAYDAAAQAYLSTRTPYRRRARVLAVLELTYAGGLLVGAPVAGWLIARWDWRAPFVAAAVVGVLSMVAAPAALDRNDPAGTSEGPLRWTRSSAALVGVLALFTLAAELTLVALGAWLEGSFGISLLGLGGIATLIGVAELAGEGVTLGVADRLGKRRTTAIGLLVSVSGYVLLGLTAGGLVAGLAGLAAALFGFEIAIVAAIPIASELQPQARARFLALVSVAMFGGRAVAAGVGPWLFTRGGMTANAVGSAAVTLVAAGLLVRLVDEPTEPAGRG